MTALISGDYKILLGTIKDSGWTGPVCPNVSHPDGGIGAFEHCGNSGCLYNIMEDSEEQYNLAQKMPDMLKEMRTKLEKYRDSHFNPDRGGIWRRAVSPEACGTALSEYGGFWGPFLP